MYSVQNKYMFMFIHVFNIPLSSLTLLAGNLIPRCPKCGKGLLLWKSLQPHLMKIHAMENDDARELVSGSCLVIIISRGAEGPGQEILQRPPSVWPSVRPSVRPSVCPSRLVFALTQKRINVFSRNFAGMCTMSWGCAV